MILSFLFHVFPLPFRFFIDISGHAAPGRPGLNGVHGGYGQRGTKTWIKDAGDIDITSDMFLCVDWSIGQWHFKKMISWYIYIYYYIICVYIYIYTAIQELKVFFYRKAVSKMIFIDFWWSKTFKNHTKPEFPLDWHNQSIDAAQATDQVTASLANNLGRLGHHEATVRDPGGSATTRLPFGNLTVLYGKPSFIFIYIYIWMLYW